MARWQLIIEYMKKNGGITALEAFKAFNETNLKGRIYDLKKMGLEVSDEWETSESGARFKRYFLK